jgi:hypothetical protein
MSLKQWREQIGRHIIHLDFERHGDAPFRAEVDPVFAHETASFICPRLSPFGSTRLERRIERFDRRWQSSSFLSTPRAWTNRLR